MPFEMRRGNLTDNLPLAVASPLFRLKQAAKSLVPGGGRFPLSAQAGQLSHQPLLFQSAGRSGTTLLRSMLVSGGDIAIPPESYVLCWAALKFDANRRAAWDEQCLMVLDLFDRSPVFHLWDFDVMGLRREAADMAPERQNLACLLDLVYRRYGDRHFPSATTWGDQSIENTLQIQWLLRAFPEAKYLHVLRDGRDVASSWVKQGRPVDDAIDMWLIDLEKVGYLRRRLPPGCFHEVRYEELVQDPPAALHGVCDFAGIPYRPEMLDYWRQETTVEHKDDPDLHGNLAKPVFTASVGSWRERLSATEQARVEQRLGRRLAENGYAP